LLDTITRIVFQPSYYGEQSRTGISVLTTKNKTLRNYTKLRVPYTALNAV